MTLPNSPPAEPPQGAPTPPLRSRRFPFVLILASIVGGLIGLGLYTFSYAKGASYLTDDPAACANCHVMRDTYTAWSRGSHRNVAACNDCHTPHTSITAKYAVKGINGFNHSLAFTLQNYPQNIRINGMNRDVVQESCRYCHGLLTQSIDEKIGHERADCLACHSQVGHD